MILAPAFRVATAFSAPAGERARLSVFIFHRVLARPDPLMPFEPDAPTFDRMLDWIGSQFTVLDPLDALERLGEGTLPARAASITFDDGYRDNAQIALPRLVRRKMPAAVFVATAFLGGGAMFNDRVIEAVRAAPVGTIDATPIGLGPVGLAGDASRADAIGRILARVKHLPGPEREDAVCAVESMCGARSRPDLMMTPAQVRQLADAGITIGGHTRNHPILCRLSDADAYEEIRGGADDLHDIIGRRPQVFAYPNGKFGDDFDDRHPAMARRAGFRFAFTTHAGAASRRSDPMGIPRFTPWDRTELRFRMRCLVNLWTAADGVDRSPAAPASAMGGR